MIFNLRKVMTDKNITSQALAEKTRIPKQTIDQYRTGRREPSFTKGMIISDALGVDPRELIEEETD